MTTDWLRAIGSFDVHESGVCAHARRFVAVSGVVLGKGGARDASSREAGLVRLPCPPVV